MISAVSFDVWNTLLRLDVIYRVMAKILSEVKNLDPVDIEKIIYNTYRKLKEMRLYIDNSNVMSFIARARAYLAKTLNCNYDDIISALDLTFSSIDAKQLLFEDVLPTLETLKSLNIEMGIIGNNIFWESTYTREVIDRLGLKKYFKVQLYSDEVGYFKPDKRIFLELCRRIDVKPSEVIHVGDSVAEDVGGALSSGMYAILIDRSANDKILVQSSKIAIVRRLDEIIEAIHAFG